MNEVCKFTAVRDISDEPVTLKFTAADNNFRSVKDGNGNVFPAQISADGSSVIAVISAKKGETIEFTLSDEDAGWGDMEFVMGESAIGVVIDKKLFTSYVYDPKFAKPYLGPMFTNSGSSFTRLDFDTREHPHHRSLFLGIGDVNGVDFWNEPDDKGFQIHRAVTALSSGSAYSSFTAANVWQDSNGVALIDEERTFTLYNQRGKCRYVDCEITFTANYGDVEFGATKEAGPLGIRVCDTMRVDSGDGVMTNSYGAVGEKECWGKSAHWCDYYGSVTTDGKEKCGITVFDNEKNHSYPTTWHIRDYGLFAPNNFFFRGAVKIRDGKSMTYKYRVIFHEGALTKEQISDKFIAYIS
jgi:hypothetical protein